MNNLDRDYLELLEEILKNGNTKSDRTGTGTYSLFSRQIRHKMSDGFPLLTTKKMAWKPMVTELLWFLQGDTNIQYLVKNNCHIWDGDAYKFYCKNCKNPKWLKPLELVSLSTNETFSNNVILYDKKEFIEKIKTDDKFAAVWGDLGKIYGFQWRNWNGKSDDELYEDYLKKVKNTHEDGTLFAKEEFLQKLKTDKEFNNEFGSKGIDQIQQLINDLKNNPDSRRIMVNAWNVSEIDKMTLPPCHYGFQCYTRELTLEEKFEWLKKNVTLKDSINVLQNRLPDQDFFEPYGVPKRALSLMWNQRSCDFPLGIPFNIASYGLLLLLLADEVNMVPEDLIGNLGDCHIYLNQLEGVHKQLNRYGYDTLPTVKVKNGINASFEDIILENYQCDEKIEFPLSN